MLMGGKVERTLRGLVAAALTQENGRSLSLGLSKSRRVMMANQSLETQDDPFSKAVGSSSNSRTPTVELDWG